MIKKHYITKKIHSKRKLLNRFINNIKINLFLKLLLKKTKVNLLYKPGYLGSFDLKALRNNQYIINLDVAVSNNKFIKVLLHEVGHLIDCLAGNNIPFSTNYEPLLEAMKFENQYVNNIDFSVEEFFAEAFAMYILNNRHSGYLLFTSPCIQNIINIATKNI